MPVPPLFPLTTREAVAMAMETLLTGLWRLLVSPRAQGVALGLLLAWCSSCAAFRDPTVPYQLPLTGTDLCSTSPDWGDAGAHCCPGHDLGYALGGDQVDRWIEDGKLALCLVTWGMPVEVAEVYYRAVRRFGGSHWHDAPPRRIGAHLPDPDLEWPQGFTPEPSPLPAI